MLFYKRYGAIDPDLHGILSLSGKNRISDKYKCGALEGCGTLEGHRRGNINIYYTSN